MQLNGALVEPTPPFTERTEPPELSNRLIGSIARHLMQTHGRELTDALCRKAGLSLERLLRPEGWVSLAQSDGLITVLLKELHGLDRRPPIDHPFWQLWSDATRELFTPEALGPLYYAVRALARPSQCYARLPQYTHRTNLTMRMELVELAEGRAEFTAFPAEGYPDEIPGQCLSRQSILEQLPTLWGLPPAHVEHPVCMHAEGERHGATCRYVVHFRDRARNLLPKLLTGGGAAAVLAGATASALALPFTAAALFAVTACGLGVAGAGCAITRGRLRRREEEVRILSESLDQADALLIRYLEQRSTLHRTECKARELHYQAIRDELTGLYNRRHLANVLEAECHRSQVLQVPFSLLLFDLDHFKAVNDSHGHLVGDGALKAVAQAFLNRLRASDVACRYGGEEFAVLLPATPREQAMRVAEQLRTLVWRVDVPGLETRGRPLTVSCGVATFPDDAALPKELLRQADSALYTAKARGRDQVVAYARQGREP